MSYILCLTSNLYRKILLAALALLLMKLGNDIVKLLVALKVNGDFAPLPLTQNFYLRSQF